MARPPSVGTEIVKRVAAQQGVDPLDLDPPLYDAIDPEALDKLMNGSDGQLRVEFVYQGYTITVNRGGSVSLDGGTQGGRSSMETSGRFS